MAAGVRRGGVRVCCLRQSRSCGGGRLCVRVHGLHTYPKNVVAKAHVARCPVVGSALQGQELSRADGGEGRGVLGVVGRQSQEPERYYGACARGRELGRLAGGRCGASLLRQSEAQGLD
jgi:hypothetical protein